MATAIDPVCGMPVDDQKAAAQSMSGGKTHYFCCKGCKIMWDANPDKYAGKKEGRGLLEAGQ